MASRVLHILGRSRNTKVVFKVVPWIAVFVVHFAVFRNLVSEHQPNQEVDRVEVSLAVGCELQPDIPVTMLPIGAATLTPSLSSGESSIPSKGGLEGGKVAGWPLLPEKEPIHSIMSEALVEKFYGRERLALLSPTFSDSELFHI